ncbi:hypothetical protein D1007_30728 [Hordeum vulgare]|nr:hypothetical protein D1007_30728 [Hordeum vulgare]
MDPATRLGIKTSDLLRLVRRQIRQAAASPLHEVVLHQRRRVRHDLPHAVQRAEPPRPRRQPRRPGRVEGPHAAHGLGRAQPPDEPAEHHVHQPHAVPAEEVLVPELPLERLQHGDDLPRRPRPLLGRLPAVERDPRGEQLLVDVGGPEPGGGAAVRVVGEEAREALRERLVDVLHDDQRLGDGAAAVDEHGHLPAVGRVGGEEELALAPLAEQVLLHVLVGDALEVQREPRPQRERARPEPQQRQPLLPAAAAASGRFSRRRRHCCCLRRSSGWWIWCGAGHESSACSDIAPRFVMRDGEGVAVSVKSEWLSYLGCHFWRDQVSKLAISCYFLSL